MYSILKLNKNNQKTILFVGLFHRGISQSLGMTTFWGIKINPLKQAKKQAAILNCPNDTSTQIVECLKKKDAQEIANTFIDMLVSNLVITNKVSLYYAEHLLNRLHGNTI